MKINFTSAIMHEGLEDTKDTYIVGNAIKAGVSRNNVNYSREELRAAAAGLIGKPLLLNHGDDDVRNIVGKVVEASYSDGDVPFKALMDPSETNIIEKIKGGFINKVSIGSNYDDKITERDADGVLQVRGLTLEELSLIPIPGVADAGISQVLHEKYQTMEVEKMEKHDKEIEELKKANEELKEKLAKAEEETVDPVPDPAPAPPAKPEPAPVDNKTEDLKVMFEEKLAALEKKVASQKGIVENTPDKPINREVWCSSDKTGKKDYFELDTKGKTLY